MEPQIISDYAMGRHNIDLNKTISRLDKECAYKDLSCVMIVPGFGTVPTMVVASWLSLYAPPNQKFCRLFPIGMEVGDAYSKCIESILAHPDLGKWKYIVTMEHDNTPQPDGLVRLLAQMEAHPEYACIGGLYYTKGFAGQPQIWGDPKDPVMNFRPQTPIPNTLQECNGTGMGFNVFRMDMFRDDKLRKPWFKTCASQTDGIFTQDLYFWMDARKHGYRCAIDTSVLVGHFDSTTGENW
jgi:hypothetical protein